MVWRGGSLVHYRHGRKCQLCMFSSKCLRVCSLPSGLMVVHRVYVCINFSVVLRLFQGLLHLHDCNGSNSRAPGQRASYAKQPWNVLGSAVNMWPRYCPPQARVLSHTSPKSCSPPTLISDEVGRVDDVLIHSSTEPHKSTHVNVSNSVAPH